jgi:hypothetical protein
MRRPALPDEAPTASKPLHARDRPGDFARPRLGRPRRTRRTVPGDRGTLFDVQFRTRNTTSILQRVIFAGHTMIMKTFYDYDDKKSSRS